MVAVTEVANAAKNFTLTYEHALLGYTTPEAIERDLVSLEEAIRAYRTRERFTMKA
jgi:hypothetical protein